MPRPRSFTAEQDVALLAVPQYARREQLQELATRWGRSYKSVYGRRQNLRRKPRTAERAPKYDEEPPPRYVKTRDYREAFARPVWFKENVATMATARR